MTMQEGEKLGRWKSDPSSLYELGASPFGLRPHKSPRQDAECGKKKVRKSEDQKVRKGKSSKAKVDDRPTYQHTNLRTHELTN